MKKQIIKTDEAPGSPLYSQGVRVGSTIYVAGMAGIDPATKQLAGATIQEQTRQALRNCRAIVEAGGGRVGGGGAGTGVRAGPGGFGGGRQDGGCRAGHGVAREAGGLRWDERGVCKGVRYRAAGASGHQARRRAA